MKARFAAIILCVGLLLVAGCGESIAGTPAAKVNPSVDNEALSFADIRDNIRRIWNDALATREAVTSTSTPSGSDRDGGYSSALAVYQDQLKGKVIEDWEGWVQHVGPGLDSDRREVMVDMDEFFERSPFLTQWSRGVRRIGFPDVLLRGITPEQAEQLAQGQRIKFSGTIHSLEQFGGDPANAQLGVLVSTSEITSLGAKEPPKLAEIDPKDVVITFTQPVCGMLSNDCYTYELIIRGDGTGVYTEDDWEHIDDPTNTIVSTFTVTSEEFANVLREFERIDYLALKDDYDWDDITDRGSSTTSITTPAYRKSVFHYYGDLSAPDGLSALEERIDGLKGGIGHKKR